MHSSNSNWVLPALYHRLYFSIPSGGDVELLITDTVGLEGAFADSTKERRFGEELTPAVTDKAAGQAQLEWLEKTLAAPKTTSWRMVAGHRPIVSGSARFVRDAVAFPVEGRFRTAMQQLMTKYQVDVYLDGACLARQHSSSALALVQGEGLVLRSLGRVCARRVVRRNGISHARLSSDFRTVGAVEAP